MPASWRRSVNEKVEYIVVDRDENKEEAQAQNVDVEDPMATVNRILKRSNTKRQVPEPTDVDSDSDDEDDLPSSNSTTTMAASTSTPEATLPTGMPAFRITMTLDQQPQATSGALADSDPTETIIVALPPPPRHGGGDRDGKISQTTEHLLIAAGSIGATIIIVMIVLALYTMRKRGLSFSDVIQQGKNHVRRGPPPPPSKYGMDQKQYYDDEYGRARQNSIYPPKRAASLTRSSSSRSQRPLQSLGRSDSFGQGLARNVSQHKSFYNDAPSQASSHHRNDSATPSSPILPVQGLRQSASTRNTRSLDGDVEELRYPDTPTQRALPPPPTFRQFLSNRPSISQRPGFGGGMASRFSWTNSNAPQTPHELSRDTAAAPIGRDSFMTQRSSVPRFRTVDSWVNQQSTRVEEQRLKQQFRMTQSSTSSGGDAATSNSSNDDVDTVPEMPSVPQHLSRSASNRSAGGGLAGKNIKHARHDTTTTVQTAPIFRAHPGTEVRFSVRSEVPSEVLDMGRKNAAL
ncbi:hypothetical protein T440DRAFT_178240 [Plenodomus tracheiphilus IPT5]|uniref:Uncharacterized protein n=1 Tax=Plenodomus tracheiphilus IPT5 TaxID=1408161 RepID=A0A6A7AYG5_9PLEO|nr:hypothetical protein T440DRAFT_178240 [Plenodomus tracheiphilus IPT5]